ncbi:MAG: sodium/proton-translocating pyrophosphatase, partial [Chloroflexi bacterium]|nr:sodium/proton-translocating pyrophosphatase [Chloroflexota bacterium]
MVAIYISILAGILALLFAAGLAVYIMKQDPGDESIRSIGRAIQEGAMAFLIREYRVLVFFIIVVFVILALFVDYDITGKIGHSRSIPSTAISYLAGALGSALTGFIGMNIAVRANTRTTASAIEGLNPALRVAFNSGAVMGISVVGIGILGVAALYWIFKDPNIVAGFGFGASSIALFARVGGGIYTKAADVGADLVGKIEKGIPEDDPRNPAVIADNVGDNVGDVAGMGADLFESYVGSIIATMALGATAAFFAAGDEAQFSSSRFVLPMLIAAVGIFSSIVGTFLVRTGQQADMGRLLWALRYGIIAAALLVLIGSGLAVYALKLDFDIFWAVVAGLVAGVIIGLSTEYFTSYEYGPTKSLARQALTGPATTIIAGFGWGMLSTIIPIVVIAVAILFAYYFAGLYGV